MTQTLPATGSTRRAPGRQPPPRSRDRRARTRRWWLLAALLATLASLAAAGVGPADLVKPSGGGLVGEFFAAAINPRIDAEFLRLTATAAVTTLSYAVLGTALSLVIGLVGGILGAEIWWTCRTRRRARSNTAWLVARAVLVVPRGIHEVVWGLFFLVVFGIDPMVAVLAIGIPFGAVTAKVFSEILDETSRGPFCAMIAAGAPRRSAVIYGLLPPALSDLLSYGFYRFECAIRSATILGLVGAGGLGFQLALSFQSLRYDEIWTLLYALILLSAGADFWSSRVRARRAGATRSVRGHDRVLLASVLAAVALIPVSMWWVGLEAAVLWSDRTWQLAVDLLAQLWPPTTGVSGFGELVELSAVTLAMSVLAIVVAFGGGVLLAFPAANMSRMGRRGTGSRASRAGRVATLVLSRGVLIVLRAIPPPVWALLFLFVLYPGILPGALALGVYTMGVLGRLMAEAAENLDGRPLRALRAQGASEPQVFCYGVIPSACAKFVAYGLYRWEVTIRETVVVGVVGAGGLGLLLDQQLATFDYGATVATLLAMIVLTLVVDVISALVRRSLR
ncbi:PhnE/PtxC family ABC transporter permease [Actinokineospora sp.]|uniref:PhnE/PtxC family ABC transporter permease n=1 Tax=Actinokineospora sp. TaxID=1872133 RepID=UPI004037B3A5